MKIYQQTNTFKCFGCGKNGDQIEFCTFKEGSKHKGLLKATELTGVLEPDKNRANGSEHIKNSLLHPLARMFVRGAGAHL